MYDAFGFSEEELKEAGAQTEAPQESLPQEVVREVVADHSSVVASVKASLDFLAAFAMPLVYKYAYPPVFLAIWSWLLSYVVRVRDFSQLALGLPRGFSKTTVIKLFIFWCILFTNKKFILIISESESKSINILSDVIDMLEERNVKAVFGDWRMNGVAPDTQRCKVFKYRLREIILMAAGAESGIRGITLNNERPDIMIFDDIQSRECADSKVQSDTLMRWLVGTAMKAKSPHGCLFIFIANMYPTPYSILRQLKKNPNWIKFIAGGILADGTSLWEDLQPIEQLKREFQNDLAMGRPDIFYAEVLNDETASANATIDLSLLPPFPLEAGDIPAGNFVLIDPSTNKDTSDAVAIGYFEVHDGYPVLMEVKNAKLSPGQTIFDALDMCFRHNCSTVAIESVAYQATLGYWFQFICTQKGIQGIEAVEVYPGGYSKNSRILGMLKSYAAGEIFVHPDCRTEVHLQITSFNPLKTNNIDDILDCLAYAPKVVELYGEYIVNMSILQAQEHQNIPVLANNSPF